MRLIDADALMERADEVTFMGFQAAERKKRFMDLVSAMTEGCKTIDAVPVVRCKECKHFRENTDRHGGVHMNCIKSNHIPKVKAEHFCSYGERKDGDGA